MQPVSKWLNPSLFLRACQDAYGFSPAQVEENIRFTNLAYGSKNIHTSSTFFTHGSSDSWNAAGILPPTQVPVVDNYVALIANGTHCSDLRWPSQRDSESLKSVRLQTKNAIKSWLA